MLSWDRFQQSTHISSSPRRKLSTENQWTTNPRSERLTNNSFSKPIYSEKTPIHQINRFTQCLSAHSSVSALVAWTHLSWDSLNFSQVVSASTFSTSMIKSRFFSLSTLCMHGKHPILLFAQSQRYTTIILKEKKKRNLICVAATTALRTAP